MITKWVQLAAALLVAVGTFQLRAEECQIPQANQIRIMYVSHRNTSGHRLIKSDFQRPISRFKNLGGESLEIVEDRLTINGNEVLTTRFQITVDPPWNQGLDYEEFPGIGHYKLHLKAVTWHKAVEICRSEGANLIVINSETEASIVKNLLGRKHEVVGETYNQISWCGFYRITERTYKTVYGTPLEKSGYNKWIPGDSNGTYHDCGCMDKNALMCGDPCGGLQRFICEQV